MIIQKLRNEILHRLPKRWAGYLRSWRMRASLKRFEPHWVTHSYAGQTLKIRVEDDLGRGWYDNDWEELPEVAFLAQRRLRHGATVFDIGAHQGIVAMMMAAKAGATGKVIAVEANAHNARVANINLKANAIENVEIVQAAVADHHGTIVLNEGLNGQLDDGTGSWGQTPVNCLTIDGLAETHGMPDVVFIDIEGAECLALEGAKRVLAHGADFFVEVHVKWGLELLGGSIAKVLSYFPRDRFELWIRNDDDAVFHPLTENDSRFDARFYLIATEKSNTSVSSW